MLHLITVMVESSKMFYLATLLLICSQAFAFHIGKSTHSSVFVDCIRSSFVNSPEIPSLKGVKTKINTIVPTDEIVAVRVRHIALASEELANECHKMIKAGEKEFSDLANTLSICDVSNSKGGELGWTSLSPNMDDDHPVLPLEVLNTAYRMNKGDMIVTHGKKPFHSTSKGKESSEKTWYVLQLMDVQARLNKSLSKRRKDTYAALKGYQSLATDPESILPSSVSDGPTTQLNTKRFTYHMETMGCQMNMADSERIEGQLRELGYHHVEDSQTASLILLNTCAIRDHSEQKVYSHVGPHALRKKEGEEVSIIVTGCVAQQEGEALTRRFPEIDVVMGPQYSNRMYDILTSISSGYQLVITDPTYQSEDLSLPHRASDVTAWVNIIYGCNERCTYCVVPTTRGVEQSRTVQAIVREVESLVREGYREVTLLGQNVDAWGRDMSPKQKFADLLTAVGQVPGIGRVRFLTSHPKYMSERVITAVANNPVLAKNFNVPFQSGNNEVLRNMRRGYTRERYLEIVKNIRKHTPDASITADVIVGFPGETEEQFEETLDLMREVEFELVNTAAYSPRPNTPAALWDIQVDEVVKQDRLQRINRLVTEHAMKRSQRFLGRTQEVLVEDVNPKRPGQVMGRNDHNKIVFFDGDIHVLKGKFVPVLITEARPFSLTGQIAGKPR